MCSGTKCQCESVDQHTVRARQMRGRELGVLAKEEACMVRRWWNSCSKPFALEEVVDEVLTSMGLECWPGSFRPDLGGVSEIWNFFFLIQQEV